MNGCPFYCPISAVLCPLAFLRGPTLRNDSDPTTVSGTLGAGNRPRGRDVSTHAYSRDLTFSARVVLYTEVESRLQPVTLANAHDCSHDPSR